MQRSNFTLIFFDKLDYLITIFAAYFSKLKLLTKMSGQSLRNFSKNDLSNLTELFNERYILKIES